MQDIWGKLLGHAMIPLTPTHSYFFPFPFCRQSIITCRQKKKKVFPQESAEFSKVLSKPLCTHSESESQNSFSAVNHHVCFLFVATRSYHWDNPENLKHRGADWNGLCHSPAGWKKSAWGKELQGMEGDSTSQWCNSPTLGRINSQGSEPDP